ncbi:MerR family transcriptional regulator [Listeria innocua]|uniref:MerR family transcriptional regulator n=1 Tax=Listeria innocua TaxID=1642 RepID=UPI0016284F5C|nr:MerR family transcriptional regulator [Listeria innocua]
MNNWGLLKTKCDRNNYRIFTNNDLKWVEFIQRAKATGMSLSKIVDTLHYGNKDVKL